MSKLSIGSVLGVLSLLAAGLTSSCATTSIEPGLIVDETPQARSQKPSRTPRVRVGLFHQDIELGELEYDYDDDPPGTVDVEDIERKRTGARFVFGGNSSRGYFQILVEDYDDGAVDALVIGGGVAGEPRYAEDGEFAVVMPYRVGVNLVGGEGDVGATDYTMFYGEVEGELGVGVRFFGLRPAVGLYFNGIAGAIKVESVALDSTADITGGNAGGYAELLFHSDHFPLYASARVQGGDVEGTVFTLGAAF